MELFLAHVTCKLEIEQMPGVVFPKSRFAPHLATGCGTMLLVALKTHPHINLNDRSPGICQASMGSLLKWEVQASANLKMAMGWLLPQTLDSKHISKAASVHVRNMSQNQTGKLDCGRKPKNGLNLKLQGEVCGSKGDLFGNREFLRKTLVEVFLSARPSTKET